MKRLSGLKLLEEREGAGTPANKGDFVVYNTRMFLNQGEEVSRNTKIQSRQSTFQKEMFRVEGGTTFIDHTFVLGRHQLIADVEHVLTGMKVGGYRKVRVSPHLVYRDKGIPDLAPPDAVLICQIWLRNSTGSSSVESLPGGT
jgi:FKBP-type peptidyl-prolyl cis-trans isomerase (trigger factor)